MSAESSARRHRMAKLQWHANKRTLPPPRKVPQEILERVDELRESGAFEEAVALLDAQPRDDLLGDNRALVRLGLARFGIADYDGALDAFELADRATDDAKARIAVNRANVLKVTGEFDAALEAACEARELAPGWFASHLIILSVLECRNGPGDRAAVERAAAEMREMWAEFRTNREFWRYLMTDVDYSSLRRRPEFVSLFGDPPEDLHLEGE